MQSRNITYAVNTHPNSDNARELAKHFKAILEFYKEPMTLLMAQCVKDKKYTQVEISRIINRDPGFISRELKAMREARES